MPAKKKPDAMPASPEARRWEADTMVDGSACAAVAARSLSGIGNGAADAHDLRCFIADTVKGVAAGDLSVLEKMLLSQSVTLQAMFADLAFKAQQQTSRDNLQTVTSLALKAATGSRQAITALAELRMPKQVLFAKQANVNNGGQQQVNNGGAAPSGTVRADARPPAANSTTAPSELLEQQYGQWMDPRAAGTASGADSRVEALGEVHRPAHR